MPTPRKYKTDAERYAAYRQRKKEARNRELQAKGLPPLPGIPTIPGTRRWRALKWRAINRTALRRGSKVTVERRYRIGSKNSKPYSMTSTNWTTNRKRGELQN